MVCSRWVTGWQVHFAAISVCGFLAMPHKASAVWLHCLAEGNIESGTIAYFTTIADVGPLPPPRLTAIRQLLVSYVTKQDPSITSLRTICFPYDEQLDAAAHFSRLLNNQSRVLGWEHMVVLEPSDWLPFSNSGPDPFHP